MGKQFIQVPVEPIGYPKSFGEVWINGRLYTWNRLLDELSKPKDYRMKIIAVIGNRGIGKSSLARIMTVQCKDVMVVESQRIIEIPMTIRTELYNVIEIHSLPEREWRPTHEI